MQAKVVGGAGPLRINASDLMQEYEQYNHRHTPLQLQQIQIQQPPGTPGYNLAPMILDGCSASSLHLGPYADVEEMCGEDGPVFSLFGGEMYLLQHSPNFVGLFYKRDVEM